MMEPKDIYVNWNCTANVNRVFEYFVPLGFTAIFHVYLF